MFRLIPIILMAAAFSACDAIFTDQTKTQQTLTKMGFSHVEAGGYAFFSCGDDYTYATKFTAVNPAGIQVDGVVCCGWLKGCSAKF